MANFRDYKYVGMPFHAEGFPGPVYSHLMGSQDGLNWDDLKTYNFGWRDVDLHVINGKFYAITGSWINISDDLENFTTVSFDSGLKNCWASELTQDKDGNWWIFYSGGGDVEYCYFDIYARTFDPKTNTVGDLQKVNFSDKHGRIDPNMHYLNGKYYLWVSISDYPQKLQLYEADDALGTYTPVKTNINDRRQQLGFTWNEAPEMLIDNGKYYLYCDPWNAHQTSESDRDIYRSESTDMINWSEFERCNADCTIRHFTPLIITPYLDQIPDNTNITITHPEIPNLDSSKINLWSGNPSTLYRTNMSNFEYIQSWIKTWNNSKNDNLVHIETELDLTKLEFNNRKAYSQFIDNTNKINRLLTKLIEIYDFTGNEYQLNIPDVSDTIIFDKDTINTYWSAVQNGIDHINEELKYLG